MTQLVSERQGTTKFERNLIDQTLRTTIYRPAHILLREALQNSCDQVLDATLPVGFSVSLTPFRESELEKLRGAFFADCDDEILPDLMEFLDAEQGEILAITDQNTKGLSGPTENAALDESWGNFLNFFYRYGRGNDDTADGGAAGVGRNIFLACSVARTIIAISRTNLPDGTSQLRVMGHSVSNRFTCQSSKYTGLHWWGKESEDGFSANPLVDLAAETLLNDSGLARFVPRGSGTTILVLGPTENPSEYRGAEFRKRRTSSSALYKAMINGAEIFAWPHIIDGTVEFMFDEYGEIHFPRSPEDIPLLSGFAEAYRKQESGSHRTQILARNTVVGAITEASEPVQQYSPDLEGFELPSSSVALMRQARFVVKYMPVVDPADGVAIKGVFISERGVPDQEFRRSEPATHDDWIPEKLGLPAGTDNPVKIAIGKIKSHFTALSKVGKSLEGIGETVNAQSKFFGQEFLGLGSWGAQPSEQSKSSGAGSTRKPRSNSLSVIAGEPLVSIENNLAYYEFHYELHHAEATTGVDTQVVFTILVRTSDGQLESSVPFGAGIPEITGITLNGYAKGYQDLVIADDEWSGRLTVSVQAPLDVALEMKHRLELVMGED